ncbi:MAG: glycosyltransferase family 2 protein [Chlamydiales bacterium]|nr:glycosyltransferase family 2 protein [Chlamydiales bacterium]
MSQIKYSVLIPLKDEEGNIRDLVNELEPIMHGLNEPWELLCIDDGSQDSTRQILDELALTRPHLRVIAFSNNYGQSSAFAAGFQLAKGQFVITLDGDRQNDPTDIPKLLAEMHDCDMACGSRRKRKDSWWRRIVSRSANQVRRWVCQDGMIDNNCSLKVYRTECLKRIKMYEGMHRFLPALFIIEGFRIKEIPVNHRERARGKSKYNMWNRGVNTVFDLFAVFWMRRRALRYRFEQKI